MPSTRSGWPSWWNFLVRWLDLTALTVALGTVAVTGRVLSPATTLVPVARRRALTIGVAAGLVGFCSAISTPFLRTPRGRRRLRGPGRATLAGLGGTSWADSGRSTGPPSR